MNGITTHRKGRLLVAAAAAIAVPAALPSGAAAHHQCVPSDTFVSVDPSNQSQPVDAGHRLPIFNSCGPHRISATYTEHDGTRDELALQGGEFSLTHTRAEREPSTNNPPSNTQPSRDARPARKAKRSCNKSRRAKARAKTRAQRRTCRRRRR